jgi:hypothetical protein
LLGGLQDLEEMDANVDAVGSRIEREAVASDQVCYHQVGEGEQAGARPEEQAGVDEGQTQPDGRPGQRDERPGGAGEQAHRRPQIR